MAGVGRGCMRHGLRTQSNSRGRLLQHSRHAVGPFLRLTCLFTACCAASVVRYSCPELPCPAHAGS